MRRVLLLASSLLSISAFSSNEISGFTTGFGFLAGGFFLGSGSVITALLNDSKQADLYLGFRIGI